MRYKLVSAFLLLVGSICYSQVYPGYFQRNSYFNGCDYIVKGENIDKKNVAFLYDDSIVALKIHVLDKFGYDICDTIWIYPDLERFFNKRNRIDPGKRDSVLILTLEDVDYNSETQLNYDKRSEEGQQGFFRFWMKDDVFIYSLEDNYFPLPIIDNKVEAYLNKLTKLVDKRYVKTNHFERKIVKKRKRQISK